MRSEKNDSTQIQKKLKWEKPCLMVFEKAKTEGTNGCSGGSGYAGTCFNGLSAVGNCTPGTSPTGTCVSGSSD